MLSCRISRSLHISMIEREYHTYLKLERGLSSHSIDAYERDLHRLKMYMDEHGIDIVHATFDDLQAFVFDVFKEIDSAKTQARLLSGIQAAIAPNESTIRDTSTMSVACTVTG